MKKIYLIFTLLGVLFFSSACNDEWKDELYSQMVSFKAPINTDVTNLYLEYQTDGEVVYNLPLLVSGSTNNGRNLNVKIGVDNDTIPALNNYLYTDRSDLYYWQLDPKYYEFASSTCQIPSGSSTALFPIKFKFADLDLVEKYVLPVTIEPDASYTMNTYKGRNKALLWVRPFNAYSGTYSASSMEVHNGNDASSSTFMVASNRTAQVVDENTIFWYAGVTEELSTTRGKYKIRCTFSPPDSIREIIDPYTKLHNGLYNTYGRVTLDADNSEGLNFSLGSADTPTYTISETYDPDRPYVIRRITTLRISYRYTDFTSSENFNFPYFCRGTMSMQRNINTLVPSDMQADYW